MKSAEQLKELLEEIKKDQKNMVDTKEYYLNQGWIEALEYMLI